MRSLKGKVAVVTGASLGIGRAVAVGLGREGCKLVLMARGSDGLNETCAKIVQEGGQAVVVVADLANPSDVEQAVAEIQAKHGTVDILWNGAFGWIDGKLEDNELSDISSFIDGSIRGTITFTRLMLPLMTNVRDAHLINVSCDWEFPQVEGLSVFIAAKRAVAGFGIALQKEKYGQLRVTNLHPADVASKGYDLDEEISDVLSKTRNNMIPLRELVDTVLYILKLEASIVHQINIKPLEQDIDLTYI